MKRKFSAFMVLFSALFLMSSCLKDDTTEVTYSDDTAVTVFSLGTVNNVLKKKYQSDVDSIVTKSLTSYAFTIDQASRLIYNEDSLPYDRNVAPYDYDYTAVTATVTTKNSGVVVLVGKNTAGNDTLLSYTSGTKYDITTIKKLRVYNASMTAYSEYNLDIRIHQRNDSLYNWVSDATNSIIQDFEDVRAVAMNGKIYAFGQKDNATKVAATSDKDVAGWNEVETNIAFSADAFKSIAQNNGKLYILSNGTLYSSSDAANWTAEEGDASTLKQLLGYAGNRFIALNTSNTISSSVDLKEWKKDELAADTKFLPSESLSLVSFPSTVNESTDIALLIGNRAAAYGDSTATIWNKMIEYSAGSKDEPWTYAPFYINDPDKAPYCNRFAAVAYNDRIEALNNDGVFYYSTDKGLRWFKDTKVEIPNFQSTSKFAFIMDSNNYLWFIDATTGRVMKGRHNSVGDKLN